MRAYAKVAKAPRRHRGCGHSTGTARQDSARLARGGEGTFAAIWMDDSCARGLKTLSGLIPYEYICKVWTSEPDSFIFEPIRQMPGLNA